MRPQSLIDMGPCGLTEATPVSAEIQHGQAVQRIHIGTGQGFRKVGRRHAFIVAWMASMLVRKMPLSVKPLPISAKGTPVFSAAGRDIGTSFAERPGRAQELFFGRSFRFALISYFSYLN
jgi:hypothetical protein